LHLKRVELENFKSFGRRLTIPFLDGFTAITGPNGSGKSNIGDAILFVLGPKSNKAIRAGKLTDLIFNGGKERKPADMCRVSLVFDNADRVIPVEEDEVTLTRLIRLSKNNPENYYSYFYVNGKPSSLTEFDTLLAHSRISADGYNIVRQGDVLRIVEMTPLDRRRILDDIAGITAFDEDIAKANAQKGEVEQNLDRIRIILDEIERQLATLERERDAALKYKTVKEALDLAKAKLGKRREEALVADLARLGSDLASHERERVELETTLEGVKDEIREAEEALAAIERRIADRGGPEAQALRAKIEDLRARTVRATERANYARQEMDDLKKDRAGVEGDFKRVEKELAKLLKEKSALEAKASEAESKLATADAGLKALRETLSSGQGRAAELERELAKMRAEHESKSTELHEATLARERAVDRVDRLKSALAEAEEAKGTAEFEIRDIEWEAKEIRKETDGSTGDVEGRRKALFEKKRRESDVSKELRELEPAIRSLQNDYSRLKAEADASEAVSRGYTRAVDAVMTARDQGKLKGICGTVAELADVQKKHARAMEVAAGGRMQAIVTETDADAAEAIEFLKRNRLGRATFLPLSKMVPGRPAGKPLMAVRDPSAEGFAIDLISFDDKYRPAFWYVFRDTVIVNGMDAARRLMGGVRLVTLEGEVIDAAGAMTGGHDGDRDAKLKFGAVAREDVEKIASKLRAALSHQETLSQELADLRVEIESLEKTLRDAGHATAEKTARLAELEKKRKTFEEKLAGLVADADAKRVELAAAEAEVAALADSVATLTARLGEIEAERGAKGKLLLQATDKDLAAELTRLQTEVETLKDEARGARSSAETKARESVLVEERKAEIAARLESMTAARETHEKALAEAEEAIKAGEEELAVLLSMEAQQNEEMRGLHAERDRAYQRKTDLAQRAEKLREKAQARFDLVLQLKTRIPAVEEALAEARAELALMAVQPPVEFPESADELKAAVRRGENELERLGNVNMLALEEYDRQAARKTELVSETEHLNVEREKLSRLVEEIVARKKEGFFRVFDEINKNFGDVYARLSDGGKAELVLEFPEDPFQGGLTMRAQPKGKKVTRLEALSGGEKSLTSMAFIFAIQEYSPSPFYYLDEVDQNLDGINSELLARMVKANSHHAQHIVVSLRKVTLKEAEHVYGVTMVESGLSEIVGEVRISEIVEEPAPQATVGGGAE